MKFWDSSAILPLLVWEKQTDQRESQLSAGTELVVWWGTRIECLSAICRRSREGILSPTDLTRARSRLDKLSALWFEVPPSENIRRRAERLLVAHPLRAAHATQLSAALMAFKEDTVGHDFLTSDLRLGAAATAEGFSVL